MRESRRLDRANCRKSQLGEPEAGFILEIVSDGPPSPARHNRSNEGRGQADELH